MKRYNLFYPILFSILSLFVSNCVSTEDENRPVGQGGVNNPWGDTGFSDEDTGQADTEYRDDDAHDTYDNRDNFGDTDETAPDTEQEPEPEPSIVDCDNLPPLPAPYTEINNIQDSEDFVFSEDGYMYNFSTLGLFKTPYRGKPKLLFPGLSNWARGIRILPSGDVLIINDNAVRRIDPQGNITNLAAGLSGPNQMVLDMDGNPYISDMYGRQVVRMDPNTGKTTRLASFLNAIDGIVFSPDYKILYVNTFNGLLNAIPLRQDGTTGMPKIVAKNIAGWPDGMTVDVCGNIYVTDHFGPLRRVTPEGKVEVVAVFNNSGGITGNRNTPAANFGTGIGGWDEESIYVIERGIPAKMYEIKVGVPGKKVPLFTGP